MRTALKLFMPNIQTFTGKERAESLTLDPGSLLLVPQPLFCRRRTVLYHTFAPPVHLQLKQETLCSQKEHMKIIKLNQLTVKSRKRSHTLCKSKNLHQFHRRQQQQQQQHVPVWARDPRTEQGRGAAGNNEM